MVKMKKSAVSFKIFLLVLVLGPVVLAQNRQDITGGKSSIGIPTIDISGETFRQVVIARGTKERQGHPSALLMPDGKTMFVIWTIGHGGPADQLKKSVDGGLTWSDLLEVPDNWKLHSNCPPLYLLQGPDGKKRITTYVNRGPYGLKMYRAYSEDKGATWSPFKPVLVSATVDTLIADVMPFTSIVPIEGGKRLLGVTNIRRPYEGGRTNILAQSISDDGGVTWGHWRMILDLGDPFIPCEPEVIRSPGGKQLLMIIRENNRTYNSWIMLSDNEGRTWHEPFQATASVTMDRHQATYAPDGRVVIVGRDVARESPTKGHFVAWVGTYDDLVAGRELQYRIKLIHTYATTEYPGLVVLPDGTFVAINSVGYRPGEKHSIVSTRFNLREMDAKLEKGKGVVDPSGNAER
jgi:hypothetical protein